MFASVQEISVNQQRRLRRISLSIYYPPFFYFKAWIYLHRYMDIFFERENTQISWFGSFFCLHSVIKSTYMYHRYIFPLHQVIHFYFIWRCFVFETDVAMGTGGMAAQLGCFPPRGSIPPRSRVAPSLKNGTKCFPPPEWTACWVFLVHIYMQGCMCIYMHVGTFTCVYV